MYDKIQESRNQPAQPKTQNDIFTSAEFNELSYSGGGTDTTGAIYTFTLDQDFLCKYIILVGKGDIDAVDTDAYASYSADLNGSIIAIFTLDDMTESNYQLVPVNNLLLKKGDRIILAIDKANYTVAAHSLISLRILGKRYS